MMPAARGVKRTASKASGSAPPKIKKKNVVTLEIPTANKVRGRILACGQGDVGQLGLGEDVVETTRFAFVSALGEKVVDVCAGGMHTVALDSDGNVWTFGCNDEGALGRETSGEADEVTPKKVSLPEPAVAISAGDSHTAALLHNGEVYVWGSFRDSHGSMGLQTDGRDAKPCRTPVRLGVEEPCVAIASGSDHTVVLSKTGVLLSVGCGEQGQLGRLPQRSASRHARHGLSALLTPTAVPIRGQLRNVWAGSHATLALETNSNKVLAWGLNNYNQLGIKDAKKRGALYAPLEANAFTEATPAECPESGPWTHVACGQHHSLALDSTGTCYAVGRCEYGRLGLGADSGDAEGLTKIPTLSNKKVISIAAGTATSFAVTDTGEVYAWGMGSEGQLGTGAEEDVDSPRMLTSKALQGRRALKVSAGGQHTVLLVANVEDTEDMDTETPAATTSVSKQTKPDTPENRESEVSSTSVAEPMKVQKETKPQAKINGDDTPNDEKTETPMETETDSAEIVEEKTSESKTREIEETDKPEETSVKTTLETVKTTEKITFETEETPMETENPTVECEKITSETEIISNGEKEKSVETSAKELVSKVGEIESKTEKDTKTEETIQKTTTEISEEKTQEGFLNGPDKTVS